MVNENASDLPQDWTTTFDDDAREFLFQESRQRLSETIAFGDQQEAKALALIRISLVIISASGIFGDLQVQIESPLDWNLISWASVLAIGSSLLVGGLTFWILHPQSWETGANVGWLARWAGANRREMTDAALETLVEGFQRNSKIIQQRGERLVWLLRAVAVQTFFVVLVQVAAAVESETAAGGSM
jgi:hypothetical protein